MKNSILKAWVKFFVCFFFGPFGVHKFIEKKFFKGVLYFFTGGLFYIGWLIDTIKYLKAVINSYKEAKSNRERLERRTRAAELGDANYQYYLGEMYCEGEDVPQDLEKAVYWITKSAEQGHEGALFKIAELYQHGLGAEKNYEKAVSWLMKAWRLGIVQSGISLGNIYRRDLNDYDMAIMWYEKVAEQGDISGALHVADLYRRELKNMYKAAEWYEKAAEMGYEGAEMRLGGLYYDYGYPTRAAEWYGIAAEKGNDEALKALRKTGSFRWYYERFASEAFKAKYTETGDERSYSRSCSNFSIGESKTEEPKWWEEGLKDYNADVYDAYGNRIASGVTEEQAWLMGAGEHDDGT